MEEVTARASQNGFGLDSAHPSYSAEGLEGSGQSQGPMQKDLSEL